MNLKQEALHYIKLENQKVQCKLCPHECIIDNGSNGFCRVRDNHDGVLYAASYGIVSGINNDPIEKKPLYHFHPGKPILSVGGYGCNFRCPFCQNHSISQMATNDFPNLGEYTPEQIIELYKIGKNSCGIAFTYNEPTVNYEFVFQTSILAHQNDIPVVLVTNGFINPEPFNELTPYLKAMNIDLKAFSDDFYRKQTGGSISPVLQTIKTAFQKKIHLELTFLVIPTLNDKTSEFRLMLEWIASNLSVDVPLHISRYFPRYRLALPPTPEETLHEFYNIATQTLSYVYLGNVALPEYSKTQCTKCYATLIERNGYYTKLAHITSEGNCYFCGTSANVIF